MELIFRQTKKPRFQKIHLVQTFLAVSYSSRNKYLSTNDKIYSNVVQETQAEMALTEVAETIFQENLNQERNNPEEEVGVLIQETSTSTKHKVVPSRKSCVQNIKPNQDYSLGFIFPGNCVEIHKEIKTIFDEEMKKMCNSSKTFKVCFQNYAIVALFEMKKAWSNDCKKQTLIKSSSLFRF